MTPAGLLPAPGGVSLPARAGASLAMGAGLKPLGGLRWATYPLASRAAQGGGEERAPVPKAPGSPGWGGVYQSRGPSHPPVCSPCAAQ